MSWRCGAPSPFLFRICRGVGGGVFCLLLKHSPRPPPPCRVSPRLTRADRHLKCTSFVGSACKGHSCNSHTEQTILRHRRFQISGVVCFLHAAPAEQPHSHSKPAAGRAATAEQSQLSSRNPSLTPASAPGLPAVFGFCEGPCSFFSLSFLPDPFLNLNPSRGPAEVTILGLSTRYH